MIRQSVCAVFLVAGLAWGQPPASATPAPSRQQPVTASFAEGQVLPLWQNGAPGALGDDDADVPTMAVYKAPRPNGTAILVFPGGAYGALALVHEGRQWAYWYNAMGITAFVVKYRLGPRYHHPRLGDAQRAIRSVRARAAEFGVRRTASASWASPRAATSYRPPPRISMRASPTPRRDRPLEQPPRLSDPRLPRHLVRPRDTHAGSVRNLLGDNPDPKLIENLSNDIQVTARTPPTFLFHTANDGAVPVENSILFFLALRKAGVPAELHVFENGPHGVGMALSDPSLAKWTELLAGWLRAHGLMTPATTK